MQRNSMQRNTMSRTRSVKISELSFSTYSEVMDSWERIRRVKDYRKTFGMLVFTKFVKMHPDAISLFGLKGDEKDTLKCRAFLKRSKDFVDMFDSLIDMLGPNADMLTDILREMGQKQASSGVKKAYYPAMGIALIEGLRVLDKKFTIETELCWKKVYHGISVDMAKVATQ